MFDIAREAFDAAGVECCGLSQRAGALGHDITNDEDMTKRILPRKFSAMRGHYFELRR